MKRLLPLLIVLLLILQPMSVLGEPEGEGEGDGLLSSFIGALKEILNAILNLDEEVKERMDDLFFKIYGIFAEGIAESSAEVMKSVFSFEGSSLERRVEGANEYISRLAFAIANLSFFISLILYSLPISVLKEEWRAIGRNGMVDSCTAVVLLAFSNEIILLISSFVDSLSETIIRSLKGEDLVRSILNILLGLVDPETLLLLLIGFVASLISAVLIVISFIMRILAPTIFLLALLIFALPFQLSKRTANRLFLYSLAIFFLKPLGYGILAINQSILESPTPLSPLIMLFLDFFIIWTYFQVSKDLGVSYPILTGMKRVVERATFLTAIYLGYSRVKR